ncbi:CehA/McbA family metallohydrolase [Reichenbachiella sp.]|uniref:CehA/McbA family metallohydrolase n=1 Tax=Reichenbachiella sp. TaxID=2184521 RepID=UPI003BAF48D2
MKKSVFLLLGLLIVKISTKAQNQVFYGNLHSHTSYSDGSGIPEDAYKHARDVAGLDFMAITEHNHERAPSKIQTNPELYSGSIPVSLISTAKRYTENGRFVALYGQEFSSISSGNHANVLEVNEVIETSEVKNGAWNDLLDSWLPSHQDSQGDKPILLLNHPATSSSPNYKEYGIDDYSGDRSAWLNSIDKYAQLINIVNGPSHRSNKPPGKPSESEFLRYLNMGLHVAPTADQDNHLENWGSAADTRTGVIADNLDKASILSSLRNRNVFATQDKNLKLLFRVNGELMGKIFDSNELPATNSELDISIEVSDSDEPYAIYKIDIYKDVVGGDRAKVVNEIDLDGNQNVSIDGINFEGKNEYLFVKVTQTDDDGEIIDHAWSAPIWFSGSSNAPLSSAVELSLNVDPFKEEATITNIGDVSIDLKGWELISEKGNQTFTFKNSKKLEPSDFVVVTSGKNAKSGNEFIKWTESFIWSNNSPDKGILKNESGHVIVTTE